MQIDRARPTIAACAFASAALTPFWFGTVERSQWIPLWQLWLAMGFISSTLERPAAAGSASLRVSRALLAVHAVFALQLVPLPAAALRLVSPGSFAAHFLPDPGDGRWRPISVSPSATAEAWLYLAGLQGLFLAIQGLSAEKRRGYVHALVVVMGLLAVEGLWQSRSDHPYWLYGAVPTRVPSGFETAGFGPYLNRNHFATVMAVGCGLSAGLAAARARAVGGFRLLLPRPTLFGIVVVLAGASASFLITAFASGSRSGVLAALVVIAGLFFRGRGKGPFLLLGGLGVVVLALSGAATVERLQRLDIVVSRLAPWKDMTTLFRFFPGFGSGFGTFGATYWSYQRNVTYEFWRYAHNDYLQVAIEGGMVGLAAVAFALRALRRSLRPISGLDLALLGGGMAFAIQAAFDFPSHVPANAALVTCLIALCTGPGRPERSAPPR